MSHHRSFSPPFDWKEIDSLKQKIWNDMFHAGVCGMLVIGIIMLLPLSLDGKLATLEYIGLMGVLLSLHQIIAFFILLLGRRFWQERARKMIQEGAYKVPGSLSALVLYGTKLYSTKRRKDFWAIFFHYPGGLDDFFLFDFSISCFQLQYLAIIRPNKLEPSISK